MSNYKVEGYVFDFNNNPVARKVVVFSRATDTLLGSTISDPDTGHFYFSLNNADPVYVICFPNDDEDMNAKIYDRVIPVDSNPYD